MSGTGVSDSVFSIIAAFTSGLDVFKKLQTKGKRKRKSEDVHLDREAELQLSNSLRKGPSDIRKEYERDVRDLGERFAAGDAIAKASLTETLLKFNTGLVTMISSFLSGGRNNCHLDYTSLTRLSDESRAEVIDTLSQLYQRKSKSSVNVTEIHGDLQKHAERLRHSKKEGSTERPSTRDMKSTMVARVPVKNSSRAQLALVKTRTRRTTSRSSASSGSSVASRPPPSTTLTSPRASPGPSPVSRKSRTMHGSNDIREKSRTTKPSNEANRRTEATSAVHPCRPRKPESMQAMPTSAAAQHHFRPLSPQPTTPIPDAQACQRPNPSTHPARPPPLAPAPASQPTTSPAHSPLPTPLHRRHRHPIPSMAFSFASDSTKLGEIPLHKWAVPFDFDAMERLNAEAAATGCVPDRGEVLERKKGRFGFLKLLRKKGEGG
ncbi:hypothetical protein B0A49_02210 [Cryomyces minteri]|uniref:Uncharacterized protein n=1 Tax=Cryomyces minteri TaxID=331657 RepID=A0A4U0XI84_9PEZI|nr:hypothetical protein B0A49_02210 [Cryomyces minteri]